MLRMVKGRAGSGVSLAEFISKIRHDQGLSLKAVERASGKRISSGYISQIENGHETNPSIEKLIGLAKGLGINQDEIFAVARGIKPPDGFRKGTSNLCSREHGR